MNREQQAGTLALVARSRGFPHHLKSSQCPVPLAPMNNLAHAVPTTYPGTETGRKKQGVLGRCLLPLHEHLHTSQLSLSNDPVHDGAVGSGLRGGGIWVAELTSSAQFNPEDPSRDAKGTRMSLVTHHWSCFAQRARLP